MSATFARVTKKRTLEELNETELEIVQFLSLVIKIWEIKFSTTLFTIHNFIFKLQHQRENSLDKGNEVKESRKALGDITNVKRQAKPKRVYKPQEQSQERVFYKRVNLLKVNGNDEIEYASNVARILFSEMELSTKLFKKIMNMIIVQRKKLDELVSLWMKSA